MRSGRLTIGEKSTSSGMEESVAKSNDKHVSVGAERRRGEKCSTRSL